MPGSHHRVGLEADRVSVPASLARSVLLIEEYVTVRRGIRLLIESEPDFVVCGEVSSVRQALEGQWEPDVVVHGLVFADGTGAPSVTALRDRFARSGLIALTRLETPVHVHLALSAGDNGYVLKSASPDQLLDALRSVSRGAEWVQPSLGAQLARWEEIPRRHDEGSLWDLTRREQEVLELLALGYTNAEVAQSLRVALRTVEAHRAHVMQKLGLRSRAELVRFVNEQQRGAGIEVTAAPARRVFRTIGVPVLPAADPSGRLYLEGASSTSFSPAWRECPYDDAATAVRRAGPKPLVVGF